MTNPRTVLFHLMKWGALLSAVPSVAIETPAPSAPINDNLPALHMAAFGDSITRAFNANGPVDHPWNSWATGNSDEVGLFRRGHVKSHAEYLSEATGRNVIVHNKAKTGANADDLVRQVDSVKDIPIDYATMLIGANDLCAQGGAIGDGKQSDMTLFGPQVDAALNKLIQRNRDIKILLIAIPDLPRLQRIGRETVCQNRWTAFAICENLLSARITQPQLDLFTNQWRTANDDLAAIAAKYPANVLFNWRLAEYPFEREHLSEIDCFHPNINGQNLLSKETWNSGWWGQ